MAKYIKKAGKRPTSATKTKKEEKGQTKAAEYVSYLRELHKIQGVLLTRLSKELK
jgi:hypothetical protein